jgi:hypothetical protein
MSDGLSTDEKLKAIENYLQSINYRKKIDERKRIINKFNISYGYAYVLSAEYMPKIVKIGITESLNRDGFDRAKELSTTGVPGKYKVEYQTRVISPKIAEINILDNFEAYLKNKNIGHRTNTNRRNKKETFFIERKNYIQLAERFVKKEINIHKKSIFCRINLEICKEKEIIRNLNIIDNKMNQGASKEKIIDCVDDLKFQIRYLRSKRGLDSLFPNMDHEDKIFYMALNHCVEWLDAILKSDSPTIDIHPMVYDYLKTQLRFTIKLLPKTLPSKALNSDG